MSLKKLNKKADISDNVYWIMNIALLAIAIFVLTIGMGSATRNNFDTGGMEYHLLNDRVFNSLCYTEPNTLVLHQNIIDISSLKEETINKTIQLEKFNREFGIKVSLKYGDKEKEVYFNKQNYDDFRIFKVVTLKKNILVKEDQKYIVGIIEIKQAIQTRGLVRVEGDE